MNQMMLIISDLEFTLPIVNPILKFLIILLIILFAPLLLNKIKIPYIFVLIIAVAIVGPYGFNLIERESSIILSGTAGLLYIMFLAGLEIEIREFLKNGKKSVLFGLLTFSIPMALGILSGVYVLKLPVITSVLLASMFASHTLVTYPIVTKLGVKRNRAVMITVGGTMITDILALFVLAVVVGMTQGNGDNTYFITKLAISTLVFGAIVLFGFPVITRLFFKHVSDGLAQYVFVLVMVFLAASLAELAQVEGIIGALLAGIAMNRLIPKNSALMNRIEFIGNAIFIPFFLIGIGMLIDYRVMISDWHTLFTAIIMIAVATLSKYLAAFITQKSLRFTPDERTIIFGMSNARAAATLAVVSVGYSVIVGYDELGIPIRLLSDSILNGTIIMIFFTCTIASFATQRGAIKLSASGNIDTQSEASEDEQNHTLIAVNDYKLTEELVALARVMTPDKGHNHLSVASVVEDDLEVEGQLQNSKRIFERAVQCSSAADVVVNTHLRYDIDFSRGVLNLIREQKATDLVVGIDSDKEASGYIVSHIIESITKPSSINTYIYKSVQPLHTIKRHIVVVPVGAELEVGFGLWIVKLWALLKHTGASAHIYAHADTIQVIEGINRLSSRNITLTEYKTDKELSVITKE